MSFVGYLIKKLVVVNDLFMEVVLEMKIILIVNESVIKDVF